MSQMLRLVKKRRISKFSDVNEALYLWYCMACSKNIYPCGPQLSTKAKEIAARIHVGVPNFEGTNGGLQNGKGVTVFEVTVIGESGDVYQELLECLEGKAS